MPDGEIVPMSFEQVSTEYVKGQQGKYADRLVSLWFPYWRINEDGMLDTGFGLEIDLTGFDDPNGLLPLLKKGDFIYVTGRVQAERRGLLPHRPGGGAPPSGDAAMKQERGDLLAFVHGVINLIWPVFAYDLAELASLIIGATAGPLWCRPPSC